MENENTPLAEETTAQTTESNEQAQVENVSKTYTQAEVDEIKKGLFTQEQVNKMIEGRLAREKKEVQPAPVAENTEVETLKSQLLQAQNQLAEYEKKVAIAGYSIDNEFKDYVDYKVSQMTSKDKDYATALKEFMSGEGQKYIQSNGSKVSMPRPQNTDDGNSEETAAILKMKKAMKL